ncbi:SRPBCC domain-containing protein [Deinococcus alpinitundrae]|uniref:SRPBCC domain-containing protein n=1 Tax=Deinococcus alpinitundrae TaxID=468913 RepID=UPI001379E7A8|nr:SRPBCC domain-containing protein [Deinococcus alpinitundrae]
MPLQAYTETTIDAPVEQVFERLADFSRYPEWNPFTVRVIGPQRAEVGQRLTLQVRWTRGGGTTSPEVVTRVSPPDVQGMAVLIWRYDHLMARLGLLRCERVQTLSALPDAQTHYVSVETFRGPLSRLTPLKQVQRGFEAQAQALAASFQ